MSASQLGDPATNVRPEANAPSAAPSVSSDIMTGCSESPAVGPLTEAGEAGAAANGAETGQRIADAAGVEQDVASESSSQPVTNGKIGLNEHGVSTGSTEPKSSIGVNHGVEPEHQTAKLVSYHDAADLYFKIREPTGIVLYRVCAALVAAASPAWAKKVSCGKNSGRQRDGKPVVEIADPGHLAYGMDIVLSIIHYKFYELPNRPDVEQLYSIAQVVEAYDCAHLVVPFMEKW